LKIIAKTSNEKKAEKLFAVGLVLFIIASILLSTSIYSVFLNNKYINEGIETKANITNKKKEKVFVGKSYQTKYSIDILFFTKIEVNKLKSANIEIREDLYNKIKKSDKIEIIYLPKNTEPPILKENLNTFDSKLVYTVSAIMFFLMIFFIVLGKMVKNRNTKKEFITSIKITNKNKQQPHEDTEY